MFVAAEDTTTAVWRKRRCRVKTKGVKCKASARPSHLEIATAMQSILKLQGDIWGYPAGTNGKSSSLRHPLPSSSPHAPMSCWTDRTVARGPLSFA